MIISDLEILEVVETSDILIGGSASPDYYVDQYINIDFNEEVKKKFKVYSDPYVRDNTAFSDSKAFAFGFNTLTNTFTETRATALSSQSIGTSLSVVD